MSEPWYLEHLQCPDCGSALATGAGFSCQSCGFHDPTGKDLRRTKPGRFHLSVPLLLDHAPETILRGLPLGPPALTYDGPMPGRDSRELFSALTGRVGPGARLLDLGCGPRDQYEPARHLGLQYVGVDYSNGSADLLADAHAIPFKDDTFDAVLSYAVFEHLHNPFIAVAEVARVLKPGGVFVGTVSNGEPFHSSYFHHTAWGWVALVATVPALRMERLWSSMDTLRSLADMGRYAKVTRAALSLVDFMDRSLPFLAPRRMMLPPHEKELEKLYRAGSVCFVVSKTLSPPLPRGERAG